jgi:peroxin-1
MPKRATVRFQALQTCLVNLPLSIYGQLVSRQVTPQSLVVCLSYASGPSGSSSKKTQEQQQQRVYVGWSGMPARLLGGIAGVGKGEEAVEIDPVCARELGIPEGAEVGQP